MNDAIAAMTDVLRGRGYDIDRYDDCMTVVKRSDDPWGHFNKIIAKDNGVYNFIEVQMGGYDLKKRISCRDLETACFIGLAWYISREKRDIEERVLSEIKRCAHMAAEDSSDHWRGQFLLDALASLTD